MFLILYALKIISSIPLSRSKNIMFRTHNSIRLLCLRKTINSAFVDVFYHNMYVPLVDISYCITFKWNFKVTFYSSYICSGSEETLVFGQFNYSSYNHNITLQVYEIQNRQASCKRILKMMGRMWVNKYT